MLISYTLLHVGPLTAGVQLSDFIVVPISRQRCADWPKGRTFPEKISWRSYMLFNILQAFQNFAVMRGGFQILVLRYAPAHIRRHKWKQEFAVS